MLYLVSAALGATAVAIAYFGDAVLTAVLLSTLGATTFAFLHWLGYLAPPPPIPRVDPLKPFLTNVHALNGHAEQGKRVDGPVLNGHGSKSPVTINPTLIKVMQHPDASLRGETVPLGQAREAMVARERTAGGVGR